MMADSSKPAVAIDSLAKYEHPQDLENASNVWAQGKMSNKEFDEILETLDYEADQELSERTQMGKEDTV
jgi:hypothetical protein